MLKKNLLVDAIAILFVALAGCLIFQAHKLSGAAETGWLLLPLYFYFPALLIAYVLHVRNRKPNSRSENSSRVDRAISTIALLIAAVVIVFFVIPLAVALPGLGFALGLPPLLVAGIYAFIRYRKLRGAILIAASIIAIGLIIGFTSFIGKANQINNTATNDAANRAKFVLPETDALGLIHACKVRAITLDGSYLRIELTNDVTYFNEPGGFVKGQLASKSVLQTALATSGCENAQ